MSAKLQFKEMPPQAAAKFSLPALIDKLLLGLRFRQKGILLVAVPLGFELIFVFLLSLAHANAEAESRRAEHGRRVLSITDAMSGTLFAVGATLFVEPSHNPGLFREKFQTLETSLETLSAALKKETRPYPEEFRYANEVADCLSDLSRRAALVKEIVENPLLMISKSEFRKSRIEAKESISRLSRALDQLISYQEKVSNQSLRKARQARQGLNLLLYFGVASNIILCLWLSVLFSAQISRRLAVLSRNAVSMSRKELPQETVSGNDELSELDQLIHRLSSVLIETSKREKALIDNTAHVILSLSQEMNVTAVNAAVEKEWGWPRCLLISHLITELLPEPQIAAFKSEMEACRRQFQKHDFNLQLLHFDGSIMDCSWSVLWSEPDKSYFAIVRDLGQELQIEEMRKHFFSMLTHDLRSPIANLKLFIETLDAGGYGAINETGRKRISQVNESLDFLADLSSDLLDLAKMQAKGLRLSIETFAVENLIDETCMLFESLSESRRIRSKIELEQDVEVDADFLRLKQVLANLLGNALKFAPENSTVTLRVSLVNGCCRIAVIDQGKSLSKTDCLTVFEPYTQAANHDSAVIKGFGLGLAIAKNIVEAHQGKIAAELTDEGTCFWFELAGRLRSS